MRKKIRGGKRRRVRHDVNFCTLKNLTHFQMSHQKNQRSVQIVTVDVPAPISPGYLTRKLITPWRRTDRLECTETQLPSNQIWTQMEQQMYELQAIAKCRGAPDTNQPQWESPYPQ